MEEYIKLGLNIALLVFVGFGVLFGFIRGLRKTASRGIFLVLTAILTLFITIPIANALLKIKFNTNLTLEDATLSGNYNIEEILTFVIENMIGKDFATTHPEFVQVIVAIPLALIHAIMYILLFWILKYLLLPLNYLFYRLTFAPKKKKEELAFSAFNDNDPNDLLNPKPFEIQNNTEENTPSTQPEENSLNTTSETPSVDNSIFQPTSQPTETTEFQNLPNSNQDGLFVKKDPENVKIEKEPAFDFTPINEESSIKNKKEKKPKKEKKEKVKIKKHRLWGALIGGIVGLFIMSNTLLPVYGLINILDEASELTLENVSDDTISLSNQTDGVTDEILNAYDSSILKVFSRYTGLEGLALAEFDYLTTKTIGDEKINLRDDIKAIVVAAKKVDGLIGTYKEFTGTGNLSDLTKDQINILITNTKEVLSYAQDVEIIDSLTDYIIPVTCNIILKNDINLTENENINAMIKDALTELNSNSDINVFDEINAMLNLAEYLNNKNVLTKLFQNDLSNPLDLISSLDSEFSNKLFSLKTIDVTIPHVLNIALTYLDESLEFGYVKNTATAETVKNGLSNFINNTIEFSKTIDEESNILLTTNSLIPLGKAMQVAKSSGMLNNDSYNNLVDFAIGKLQDLFTDIVPEDFENYLQNELLENIAKVDNWEYEMTSIHNAIIKLRNVDNGILGEVIEGETLRQGTSINIIMKESVLINLGEALDILEETCIFGARTYRTLDSTNHQISGTASLILSIIDYADTTLQDEFDDNSDMQRIGEVLTEMKNNVIKSNHTYSKDNPFWKNEFTYISSLVINVYNMLDSQNFTIEKTLGTYLDQAKSSTMLGNGTTLTLMSVALDIVKGDILPSDYTYNDGTDLSNPQDINDKIYELFNSIDTNLKTNTVKEAVRTQPKFWENEIEYYITLSDIANKATELTTINDALTLAEDLDHVYSSFTIPRTSINNIIAFSLRDVKYTELTSTDHVKTTINNIIEEIATKLEDETFLDDKEIENFWTIEFNHIESLIEIDFADSDVKNNLTVIGQELDKVSYGYTENDETIRASYLITHKNLRQILSSAIDEMSGSLTSTFDEDMKVIVNKALTSIKANVNALTSIPNISFEFELTKLKQLSELEVSKDLVNYPTGTEAEIEAKLNENKVALETLGTNLDNISFAYAYSGTYYEYVEANNSKLISRNIINTLIIDIFELSEITIEDYDEQATINKKNAFNELISDIQTEIQRYSDQDAIISWERELSYVNTLVQLNKNTQFTISNIANEIGKNVDAIAFNVSSNTFTDITMDNDYNCSYIPASNGNSLFITRTSLKKAMNGFLSSVKYDTSEISDELEKEEKEIVNDIIDNVTNLAVNNSDLTDNLLYPSTTSAFNDLKSIDTTITNIINGIEGDIVALKASGNASTLDEMLSTFEAKPACQVLITRRIALLILKHIEIPSTLTTTQAYYDKLKAHYEENITNNSTESEYYNTNEELSTDSTHNPFDTLLDTVSI